MTEKKISFTVERFDICEDQDDSQFAVVEMDVFSSGDNRHHLYVSEETLIKYADTLYEKPLVWVYDKILDDAGGHSIYQNPGGFIPNDSKFEYKKISSDKVMLTIVGKIWKKYSGRLIEFFKRDGNKKPVSVEMEVYDLKKREEDDMDEITNFSFTAVTILGNLITPAIEGAVASLTAFSKMESEEYRKAYDQEFQSEEEVSGDLKKDIPEEKLDESFSLTSNQKMNILESFLSDYKYGENDWNKYYVQDYDDEYVYLRDCDLRDCEDGKSYRATYEIIERKAIILLDAKEEVISSFEPINEGTNDKSQEEEMGGGKEKQMEFNYEKILALFDVESDSYKTLFAESQKEKEDVDSQLVLDIIFEKIGSMQEFLVAKDETIVARDETIVSLEQEKTAFSEEIASLKEYKDGIEKERFEFEVNTTLKDVEDFVPKDELDTLREESANFSLETIDGWRNAVKAKAFVYTRDKDLNKDDGTKVKKTGLPFTATKDSKKSIWDD